MNVFYYTTGYVQIHELIIKSIEEQIAIQKKELWNSNSFSKQEFDQTNVFFLYTPMVVKQIYLSPEPIWKQYLQENYPEVKLITLGFEQDIHTNHIDLLNLPSDWKSFFNTAKKTGEEWIPIVNGGVNVQKKLEQFYIGHTDKSVVDLIGTIERKLVVLEDDLKEGDRYEDSLLELNISTVLPKQWNDLLYRWGKYEYLFECLPFSSDFKKAGQLIKSINSFFQTKCKDEKLFISSNCVAVLNTIKQLLEKYRHYGC